MSYLDLEAINRFIDAITKADELAFNRCCDDRINNHIANIDRSTAERFIKERRESAKEVVRIKNNRAENLP